MRTPGLQYLYLQKPLTLLILIATLSVLPWLGMGDYYTKGEPREASVAVSMLEEGNWILPRVYADEFAYKPPFTHWLMALSSLPQGEVTPFTSRLPSAIAFIIMVGSCFIFFGRKLKGQKSFVACLILITSFELHRAAMTSRVDMTLTCLIVTGLISLFFWVEDKKLRGLPWYIPVIFGCAALVKGPVGIILPLLIFGIYLLFIHYKLKTIIWKLGLVAILSLIPLLIWYSLAYREVGRPFLDVVVAENFGRFLGSNNLNIQYNLGHEVPFWYNFVTLTTGFIPWTLLLLFSLFSLKYSLKVPQLKDVWNKLLVMDRIKLFSLVAAVVIIIFYCIPVSKRSVYLMPAYPFIAIFIAQYMIYIAEYHSKVNRIFAVFLGSLVGIVCLLCLLTLFGLVSPQSLLSSIIHSKKTLYDTGLIEIALAQSSVLYIALLAGLCYALFSLFHQLKKKNNLKILYATFGLYFALNILLDGVVLPAFKDGTSVKPFVAEMKSAYPLTKDNMYVMNNLLVYGNLYGLNFYLKNSFQNFETVQPKEGFFFTTSSSFEIIKVKYDSAYTFTLLEQTDNRYNDMRDIVQLYQIQQK